MKGCTLLELLRFYAEAYLRLAKELQDLEMCLYADRLENVHAGKEESVLHEPEHAKLVLISAKMSCEKIGLQVSAVHAGELLTSVARKRLTSSDVKALHENIDRELSCHFFVGISEDRKAFYCESLKGWEEITAKFPEATEDIEEMNKCFALCRYSAAVFHSLLVIEHGLVKFGNLLGVIDPKVGWDASYRKLESIVNAGRNENKTGLEFSSLEQLNVCVQAMKLAWRNKVDHAAGKPQVMGGGFAPYVAEEIISTTRGFMRRLSEIS
ncbi:MAG: hypothetical protein LAN36_06530 [Acidobacteriia bacterium]|nr:hypothetical protein [Terriglobia bacterium]